MGKSRSRKGRGRGADIDARTEQVLREALEPASLAPAVPAPDLPEKPLKPAAPPERTTGPQPVSVTQKHYHQPVPPVSERWTPGTPEPAGAAGDQERLRRLLADLPVKAGAGGVADNLAEVARAILAYYEYGLSQPGGDTLPVGVAGGAQTSTRSDADVLAGYLELEKRFGRVDRDLDSDTAAAQLIRALAARALKGGDGASDEYVARAVAACLQGAEPPAGSPPSEPPAAPPEPGRIVYRRKGPAAPGT